MIYLDTSALVKLVIEEPESEHLERWLVSQNDQPITSVLGRVELIRACRRIAPHSTANAQALLAQMPLLPLTHGTTDIAAALGPPALRTLDACHLAAAIELGAELTGFIAYDKRLRDAAALADLPVMTPGAA